MSTHPPSSDTGFERSACGLLTLTSSGVILRANLLICEWLGYVRSEVEGLPFDRYLTMGGRVFSQTHWVPLMEMQGSVTELKLLLVHKDGHRIPVLINATRHRYEGEIRDEIALMVVTDRHKYERELLATQKIAAQALDDIETAQAARDDAERQLRILNQELEQANRFKDDFLATLAHELRNPLAPMRNATEILKRSDPTNHLQVRLSGIFDRQLSHMTRLVDDLADISRITQGKIEIRRSCVNLQDLISTAVESVRPGLATASHKLIVDVPEEVLILDADPTRILQSIQNLLNNSIKYTPAHGQIWLTVKLECSTAIISVRDTGIGIAPDELGSIFGMFSQLAPGLNRSDGGLGIGLALVRALVELHGGTIDAKSAGTGLGSEFTIRLPVADVQNDVPRRKAETSNNMPRPRRVLIVDDNQDSATSLEMMLQMEGHEVITCIDGDSTLKMAVEFFPEVVLLDIELPDLDGYEVAKRLRSKLAGDQIVLIAITGWGRNQDKIAAKDAGFDHHFLKPIDLKALTGVLCW